MSARPRVVAAVAAACALALTALIGIGAAASSTSVVANGSFESPSVTIATTLSIMPSWDIGTSQVKLVPGSVWAAEQGSQSIELFGSATGGPSALSQTLITVKNDVYTITFWYGANPNAGQGPCSNPAIEVLWNDTRVGSTSGYTSAPSNKGGTVGWARATIQVAATATISKVGFRSLDGPGCSAGMAVDDVSVAGSQGTPSLDGAGMMTVSPTGVAPSSTTSLLFRYGANPNASPNPKLSNGTVTIDVPVGWSAPQTTQRNGAGYVALTKAPGGTAISTTGTGTGGGRITISSLSLDLNTESVEFTYSGTAPSTSGAYTFETKEQSNNGGTLTALSTSPVVTVNGDGLGSMSVNPTSVYVGTGGNTLTLTYTAAAAMSGGAVAVDIPVGWSPPQTSIAGGVGYVSTSAGIVGLNNSTITVSGLSLAATGTFTITYAKASAPSAPGASMFAARQKSTSGGTLTAIASPTVSVVTLSDGLGSMSVSPDGAKALSMTNTFAFMYTAANSMVNGVVTLAMPSGWASGGVTAVTSLGTGTVDPFTGAISVAGLYLSSGQTFTITYAGVTAPATIGPATWPAQQKASSLGTLTALASGSSPVVTVNGDGLGSMAVSPTGVNAASTGNSLTFTYTAAAQMSGGAVALDVPVGWSPPQVTGSAAVGYVSTSAGSVGVNNSTITVSGLSLAVGGTFTVTYANATAPSSPGSSTFATRQQATASGTLASVPSPSVSVSLLGDGLGTMVVSPTSVYTGTTGNSLAFTYTASSALSGGTVSIAVPADWSAPQTSSAGGVGYVSTSAGTAVISSGPTMTVSSLNLAAGGTFTVTYANVIAPSTARLSTFSTKQRSTSVGTLTLLGGQPTVTVTALTDGQGTMTVVPSTVDTGSTGNNLVFTYTAGSNPLSGGAVSLKVPATWPVPTTTGSVGAVTSSSGTVAVDSSTSTITVSGLSLGAGATLSITYANATAPTTAENTSWPAAQRSTPAGALTALATSPTVKVQAPLQASPFSVNTDVDHTPDGCALAPGDCTLREAILAANATSGKPLPVSFTGTTPLTIQPTSPLPAITKGIVIDGITPPANLPNTPSPCTTAIPRVTIDGSLAGASANGFELGAGSDGSTIRGLTVTRFGGSGVVVTGSGNHIIQCNTLSANGIGIDFGAGASASRVGVNLSLATPTLADANAVSANTGAGIRVVGTASGENVAGNRISGNGGLGIDLLPTGSSSDGVTANDALDADTGGNNLQNTPIVFAAEPVSGGTLVSGGLKSNPSKTYLLTFYASDDCDPSGYGQGAEIVGSTSVTTAGSSDPSGIPAGEAFFSPTVAAVAAGRFVTATATDVATGDTSEFSNCAVSGPDNTVWPKASNLTFDGGGNASATGHIEAADKSRWYRFPIAPNGKVDISLTGPNGGALPANYDLVLSSDIKAKYLSEAGKSATLGSLTDQAAETPTDAINSSQFSTTALEPTTIDPSLNKPQSAGSAYFGSAYFGSAYFGSAYFGSAYFGSAYFGSAYFGSAYFGSAYFDPQVFSSAQATSVIGLSANASTTSEHLAVDTWNNTGYLYVRVVGPSGARSSKPFTLTVKDKGSACAGVNAPTSPVSVTADAGDYNTLILTDTTRFSQNAGTVMSSLNSLAADPSVKGKVVDVGGIQQIVDLNAQANNKAGCVYAKNLVADAIKQVVTAYRSANPALKYVVIGGGDDVIPFFRTPDRTQIGHESTYFPPLTDTSASQASLRLGYVLSQDGYGSATDLEIKGASIAMPDLPVGRLVETPSEIAGMVDAYLRPSGGASAPVPIVPKSSLVTGYDFVQDGADDVAKTLKDSMAGPGVVNDELITNAGVNPADATQNGTPSRTRSWTATDLKNSLLGSRHDLVYLAGHFSANDALAADYTTVLTTTQLKESTNSFKNSIVLSVGCHSGYNIVNGDGVPGVTQTLDWAQAFAQKQATLVAGTGYQYGDTDFIQYSEQLYAEFARQLRTGSGPVSVGDALVRAKQIYLQRNPSLGTLDEKAVLEATIFGLPMTKVDMPVKSPAAPASSDIRSSQKLATPSAGGDLGLVQADITLADPLTRKTKQLSTSTGGTAPEASWYEPANGSVVAAPAQPALPLLTRNVSIFGRLAVGMLAGDSTLALDAGSGALFPATPFTVRIGSEALSVTARSGDILTVQRAVGGTTAAAHSIGDVVALAAVVRGAGFRGGQYTDTAFQTPLTGAPGTELRGVHVPFSSDVFFPLRTGLVNYFGAYDGSGATDEQLKVTPAQYRSSVDDPTTNTSRVFSSSTFRLFYSGNTSTYCTPPSGSSAQLAPCSGNQQAITPARAGAPLLGPVQSSASGTTAGVKVRVYGDPRAGVQSVWVTYTTPPGTSGGSGAWTSVDLTQDQNDTTLWSGTFDVGAPASDAVFMLQSVNGVGLVSLDNNAGAFYGFGGQISGGSRAATDVTLAPPPASGKYSAPIPVSATLKDANGVPIGQRPVRFTLGPTSVVAYTGSNGVASTSLLLTAPPGVYQLVASFPGDGGLAQSSSAPTAFSILQMPTIVTLAADPPATESPAGVWNSSTIVGDPTTVYATVTNEAGAPVTERSVLFVAYETGTNNAVGALVARTNWRGRANLGALGISPGGYTVRAYFGQSKDLGGLLGVFDLTDQGYGGADSALGNLVVLTVASTLQLSVAASPAPYNRAGQTIAYTYSLKNTGNVTLAGPFTISADRAATTCGALSLAPNAQTQCSASYAVTQSDVDAGSISNSVTAAGSYSGAPVPSNTVSVTVTGTQSPALSLSALVSPLTFNALNQNLVYTFVATNAGNVTLQSPSIPNVDSCTSNPTSPLAPGGVLTCTKTVPTTQANLDSGTATQSRTATASFNSTQYSSTNSASAIGTQSPALFLVITPNPTTFTDVGQSISYSYAVRNSGNVTLSGPFTVSDSRVTVSCPSTAILAPSASATLTCNSSASYLTRATDVQAGAVTSTATVSGLFGTSAITSAPASASVTFAVKPTSFPITTLAKNSYIWFSAAGTPVGRSTSANSTLSFTNASIKLLLSANKTVTIAVPDTLVTFSTTATLATATVDSLGRWIITVPAAYTGPVFLSGVSYKTTQDLVVNSGTWTGTIAQTSGCVAWKWAAAGYPGNFSSSGSSLKIKPISGAAGWDASDDPNSAFDLAGTPDGPSGGTGTTRYRYTALNWYTLTIGNGGAAAAYLSAYYKNLYGPSDSRTPTGYYGSAQVAGTCP